MKQLTRKFCIKLCGHHQNGQNTTDDEGNQEVEDGEEVVAGPNRVIAFGLDTTRTDSFTRKSTNTTIRWREFRDPEKVQTNSCTSKSRAAVVETATTSFADCAELN